MKLDHDHRAGFVHIVGKPNVGKSTLLNYFVDYPLSIATHKAQTTRQNILGIENEEKIQVIYVDTPGYLTPSSPLQELMMKNVERALGDHDIMLWVADIRSTTIEARMQALQKKKPHTTLILLNKIDLLQAPQIDQAMAYWQEQLPGAQLIPISARFQAGLDFVKKKIKTLLPLHPPYYPKDSLTNKSERFLVADIIRKQIFLHYKQEIPYSTEVKVESFQNDPGLLRLAVIIYVERESQRGILIGKKGSALKKIGTAARKAIAGLYKKKVFLTQHVKVSPDWRKKEKQLNAWGYQ